MKKQLATLLVLASLTVAGAAVAEPTADVAAPQPQATLNCPKIAARTDPAIQEKIQQFYKDTEGLRKQIFMKRAELNAVVNAAQPDPATAGKMAGELYDLQASLRKQAQAAGLGQFGPGMGCGFGHGMGRGMGMGGRW